MWETFRYTENGPEGLLKLNKAYLVTASGGVTIGSDIDCAASYFREQLRILGINDVTVTDTHQCLNQYDRQQQLTDLQAA